MTDHIRYFSKINKNQVSLVGGKGANLGEMKAAGFPVPDGFCITTKGYVDFIAANGLEAFLPEAVKDICQDNAKAISEAIQGRIGRAEMPLSLQKEIIAALNELGEDDYYAVRSSATAEDLDIASFAGQQDSYLNLKGAESIFRGVQDCWASLFTERALLYRMKNNIAQEKIHMSVIIQKMVYPDASGILFTADPVNGNRNICTIDAGYGLGEALVGGLVNPDVYKVDKLADAILDKRITNKTVEIRPLPGGGSEMLKIGDGRQLSQVLSDSDIVMLARMGKKIEAHFGKPQDIEWCLAHKQIHIVQSRAITSLFPLPEPIPPDDSLHVYVSLSHIQMNTKPLSPLGISTLRLILPVDRMITNDDEYRYIKKAAGRIFIDVTSLLQIAPLRRLAPKILGNIDSLIGSAMTNVIERADFKKSLPHNKSDSLSFIKFAFPLIISVAKSYGKNSTGKLELINQYIKDRYAKLEHAVISTPSGRERLEVLRQGIFFADDIKVMVPAIASGIIAYKRLELLAKELPEALPLINIITKGMEGNVTTEMGLAVGDLADAIRNEPALLAEFENPDHKTLWRRINSLQGQEAVQERIAGFMKSYGMRVAGEIDIAVPRWVEYPEALVKSVLSIVKTSAPGIHRIEYANSIKNGKKAGEDLVALILQKRGRRKARQAQKWVDNCRNCMPGREHLKYLVVQAMMLCKKCFMELGEQLAKQGRLDHKEDVFYLYYWELYNALDSGEDLKNKVANRKEAYQQYERMSVPRFLTSDGEEIKTSYPDEGLPENVLKGIPVSAGIAEGTAKVVLDPAKESIDKGEILIAPYTDPGWTPLFINTAGLAMEIGGLMTHGAVVAREYGIPAVAGISDLTKKIKSGQKIRIDGDNGYVIILESDG